MEISNLVQLIEGGIPDATVYVRDLTGDGNHFEAFVISDLFLSKSRIEQHKMVMNTVNHLLAGPLHALALKTYTKEHWEREQNAHES